MTYQLTTFELTEAVRRATNKPYLALTIFHAALAWISELQNPNCTEFRWDTGQSSALQWMFLISDTLLSFQTETTQM